MSASDVRAAAGASLRSRITRERILTWLAVGALLLLCVAAPAIFTGYFLSQILTKALWLGLAAVSLIFLSRYGGMISLAQVGLYAIAGFTMANLGAAFGGHHLGWNPLAAAAAGVAVATIFGLLFGAIASRSYGIYFLMITLALSVIVFYFFAQVTALSGYGGIRDVGTPGFVGNPIIHPEGLYYVALAASVLIFAGIRYLARTPFGLALQGIRDDPARMRALGYNVALHRTLAFGVGAFIAGVAGILSVWYQTQISPGGVDIGQTINVLVIAVIGGLYWLEGAWIGALLFTVLDNYSRTWLPSVGVWLGPERFETVLGVIFLLIVLLSPGGLVGIGQAIRARVAKTLGPRGELLEPPSEGVREAP